ncbi:MAG: hypothetical protein JXA52_00235 [Planctomycetes bacterium]|nr:hypothetical protein [Planctomycetota bacterium]
MIFITVGTQKPFNRLLQAVDDWAARNPDVYIFAQIGVTSWRPEHFEWVDFITPEETNQKLAAASLIIAHAGIGSIFGALTYCKPIIIMPRLPEFGEHRNDHQRATAEAFAKLDNIYLATDGEELKAQLARLYPPPPFIGEALGPHASPRLVKAIKEFIETGITPGKSGG